MQVGDIVLDLNGSGSSMQGIKVAALPLGYRQLDGSNCKLRNPNSERESSWQ